MHVCLRRIQTQIVDGGAEGTKYMNRLREREGMRENE